MHDGDADDFALHAGQRPYTFEVDGAVRQQSDAVADGQSRSRRSRSRLYLHGALLLIDGLVRDSIANVVPPVDERMIKELPEM